MSYLIGLIFTIFIGNTAASYLQLPLIRTPSNAKTYKILPVKCQNESNLNQDAQYKEVCIQKDITYSIPFIKDGLHYALSVDFTTPISWIKGPNCIVEGTNRKCNRLTQTIIEKIRTTSKQKSRLKQLLKKKQIENTIIQGSSQIIRGQMQKSTNISFIVKDSSRLNNFFELIMLGLFIYGEKDNVTLLNTNFVNAMVISPNINELSDGALSLRFDQTAQTSFLQEIFTYVHAIQRTVTVYIGDNNTITIGDLTAKYTKFGYSGINWIPMPEDQGFGRLPEITAIGFGDRIDDKQDDVLQNITAIFTLSASYISLPQNVITKNLIDAFKKEAICKVNANNFVQCSTTSKKKLQRIAEKNLVFKFEGANIIIPMKKLILKTDQGKRVIFNIKQSYNNRVVLGEPVFLEHFFAFDYLKNRIGIAEKRQTFDEFYIELVTLVRFLCGTLVLGCTFICCYEPCNSLIRKYKKKRTALKNSKIQRIRRQNNYESVGQSKTEQFQNTLNDEI